MRKLSLSLLASGIALSASAAYAQPAGGPPPGAHMTPRPGAHMGPPAGHTWQGGGHNWQGRGMTGPPARGPNMPRTNVVVRHGGGGMHGGGNFHHRIRRGFVIPPMWFGPQFHINNWQMYGFATPSADQRWVRYYDDAYLIDRGGRVIDSREGMDWDRYGEEWDMADGIPAYRGSRDYAPDDEDYAWSEEHRGNGGHGGHGGGHGPPMAGPGYGYGGGYAYGGAYGYGYYAYPIVIETITTSGGATITEEVTETVYEVRRRARPRRARCVCAPRPVVHRPAPRPAPRPRPVRRPPPGERG